MSNRHPSPNCDYKIEMGMIDWWKLLCWPPLPSSIASKLAFLPPERTYEFLPITIRGNIVKEDRFNVVLRENVDWEFPQIDNTTLEGLYTTSKLGHKIACVYIQTVRNAKYTILFSHGNAVDLGHMCSFYLGLAAVLKCNIFGYDYSGYGLSTGKPSEKATYADIDSALLCLYEHYKIPPENVILYGQSIGTVPTVDLACRVECAAVILHSPLLSGLRLVFPKATRTWLCDSFTSIDKIDQVTRPTLIIHGTKDDIIDFSHGCTMFEKCTCAVDPLFVEGAGHSDIEMYPCYFERLYSFIYRDIAAFKSGQKPQFLITCPSRTIESQYGSEHGPYFLNLLSYRDASVHSQRSKCDSRSLIPVHSHVSTSDMPTDVSKTEMTLSRNNTRSDSVSKSSPSVKFIQ